jgi:hypothetical protein
MCFILINSCIIFQINLLKNSFIYFLNELKLTICMFIKQISFKKLIIWIVVHIS